MQDAGSKKGIWTWLTIIRIQRTKGKNTEEDEYLTVFSPWNANQIFCAEN